MQLHGEFALNTPSAQVAHYFLSCQGNERWVEGLQTRFHEEFKAAKSAPWVLAKSGAQVGEFRSAGGSGHTAGNITFVNVHNAGYVPFHDDIIQNLTKYVRHMVPHDQPEAALVCFVQRNWVKNERTID